MPGPKVLSSNGKVELGRCVRCDTPTGLVPLAHEAQRDGDRVVYASDPVYANILFRPMYCGNCLFLHSLVQRSQWFLRLRSERNDIDRHEQEDESY